MNYVNAVSAHPEPQFARENFVSLDGEWQVALNGGAPRTVRVPYCIESELSGIGEKALITDLVYTRTFRLPEAMRGGRVFLHFGAVDHTAEVFVNGSPAGRHSGGYTPFAFDVTDFLRDGENALEVRVHDDVRENFPSGKQTKRDASYGCFYTRTTGIWQSVWLEAVPEQYLCAVRFFPDASAGKVGIEVTVRTEGEFSAEIEYGGKAVGGCAGKVVHKRLFEAELSEKHLWEAGKGRLYGVRLQFEGDTVYSYFGLRDVRYEGKTFQLNGKPLFQRLVLDQGYYEKGIYTPEKEECFAEDIRLAKEAGFNGARLHQKLFDPRYLFECDRTGFIVWGEYPSWGMEYHDLAGLGAFLGEWREAMERDFNRPSIITWCPLNEVWDDLDDARLGRDVRFVDAVYSFTKALDPTRPCVDVSGGTHGNRTDVADFHCYDVFEKLKERMEGAFRGQFDFMQMYREGEGIGYKGEPLNLSEFGGVSVGGDGWGYETAGSEEQFVADYERTVRYLLSCGQLSGFCYTQLYDVEQEQNGLYTYGRKPKFSEEGMRRIRAANEAPAAIEK